MLSLKTKGKRILKKRDRAHTQKNALCAKQESKREWHKKHYLIVIVFVCVCLAREEREQKERKMKREKREKPVADCLRLLFVIVFPLCTFRIFVYLTRLPFSHAPLCWCVCVCACAYVFVCGGITRALLHAKLKLKGKLQLVITQAVERDKQLHALAAQFSSNFVLE